MEAIYLAPLTETCPIYPVPGVGAPEGETMTVNKPSAFSTFTCATCYALFEAADQHRAHYQSDWHQYNLRRKVDGLPPVVESVFLQRLGQYQKTLEEGRAPVTSGQVVCTICAKNFASENSYLNHIKSKKHLENVSKQVTVSTTFPAPRTSLAGERTKDNALQDGSTFIDADAPIEEIREAIESKLALAKRLRPEECIFCRQTSENFESNMGHMTHEHGLYIPDIDFVTDLPEMMAYLADKVAIAHCCIYCPASVQPFASLEAVRKHMIDKGHLKIRYDDEGMNELADFYDYTEEAVDVPSDDDDDEFEDISDEGLEDDELASALIISPDGSKLILPSGTILGHRAHRHTYRPKGGEPASERRPTRRSEHRALIERLSDHYLAMGLAGPSEQRKYKVDQRHYDLDRKAWYVDMGTRSNMLQEHFRYQLRQ